MKPTSIMISSIARISSLKKYLLPPLLPERGARGGEAAALLLLFFLFFSFSTLSAQQVQVQRRSPSIFAYPEFQDATIRQTFGRKLKARVNIYLKDASLVYEQNGKIMHAYTKGIIGVDFDSAHYMKVDSAMALVVAQKGYNYLLRKTTVNMRQYREEESGGTGLDFFEMPDNDVFMTLNEDRRDGDLGVPLMDKYYFNIKGVVIPANEKDFRRFVGSDQRQAYKTLMDNRFWSWKDEESLKMLLDFLPER